MVHNLETDYLSLFDSGPDDYKTWVKNKFMRMQLVVVDGQHRYDAWLDLVLDARKRKAFWDGTGTMNRSSLEGLATTITILKKETPVCVLILRLLDPKLGDEWPKEALELKNYPKELQHVLILEAISTSLSALGFDVRYFFFVLKVAKEGINVADVDKRKEFYQKYGISCNGASF
ncbi:hypothetical protein CYMTET_54670 [Cymbomonas tetramitiformis]|uniref:Uncharacterized protein n=1 Tax=Cymbomonas tetramitiformis TaxID=36881 RepID=A0AAE0ENH9_9CHLO|nr:hypothetical protein CYMTET_54670 [Cymbomonas tetramitiformis]